MRLTHPEISHIFNTEENSISTLVIENQKFFCAFLNDLYQQSLGCPGRAVLSIQDRPVPFASYAELLDTFVPFELNRKPLLNKIASALEKNAADAEHYQSSSELLSIVEKHLYDLAFAYPCDIIFPKLSMASIIKASGPELGDDDHSLCEKLIDYMELVREFDRDKLFVTINLRSYIIDEEFSLFLETVLSHRFHLIMLENHEYSRAPLEQRWIIDGDLCEIG